MIHRSEAQSTLTPSDIDALRSEEFPWTLRGDTAYLNHAGTGPLPERAIDVLAQWNRWRAEPWRVTDRDAVLPGLAHVRTLCASLIGAKPTEIALVPNTSFGLNVAARALPLDPGDVVLVSDGEFPAVIYAWRAVEETRGIRLRVLPTRDGLLDEVALLAALDAGDVRAVTVSWVSFATGYRVDLARLGAACRLRGIYFVVDAVQGLGPAQLDIRTCHADIVACGAHKWLLSPWGTGFLYVREDLIPRLAPPIVGWFIGPRSEDYAQMLHYDFQHFADARRFEVMTMPSHDFMAMGRSLELLLELSPQAVERRVRALTDHMVAWALDRADIKLVTPADSCRRAGIVALAPRDPIASSERLRAAGVIHSLREGAIRFAPYFYNTTEEVQRALALLHE